MKRPIESYIIPEEQSIKYPWLEVTATLVSIVLIIGATIMAVVKILR